MKEENIGWIDFEVVFLILEPQELLKTECLEMIPPSNLFFFCHAQHEIMASALKFINKISKNIFLLMASVDSEILNV